MNTFSKFIFSSVLCSATSALIADEFSWSWPFTDFWQANESFESSFDAALLENQLRAHVIGQEKAVNAITNSIVRYVTEFKDPKAPIGVFLFLGPSGTGKTELAKVLAAKWLQSPDSLIRFDMSYFTESHSISRLIGSPPGYIGSLEGGQLTNALMKKPKSIILLDEMEKAHTDVRKAFLPTFDDGYIIDATNHLILCNEVVFIMTSNLCSLEIIKLSAEGRSPEEILSIIEPKLIETLSPELYGRVEPIIFNPLSQEMLEKIVDKMLGELVYHMKSSKKINLILDDSIRTYLMQNGYNPILGARPLKRLIQNKLVSEIAKIFLKQRILPNSHITAFYNDVDNRVFLTLEKP